MSRASGWGRGLISFARGSALMAAAALVMSSGACGDDDDSTSTTTASTSSSSGSGAQGGDGIGAQGGAGASGAQGGGPAGGAGGDGGTGGVEATCSDGIQNGDETDVDCGGARCEPCADGEACVERDDCDSGFCDTSGGTGGAGGSGGSGGSGGTGGNGGAGGNGGSGGGGPTAGVCAPCEESSDCQTGEYCDQGSCVPALANGEVCTETAQCTSGQCVDGVCCDNACGGGAAGDCQACNLAGFEGTCSLQPATTACGSATADACTAADTCDAAGVCQPNNAMAGAACGDQGVACHVDDTCNGMGACTDNGLLAVDTPCGSATNDACTNPDTCNAAGICAPNNEPAGAACGDQGVACHVDDTCDGNGACADQGFVATGTACGDPAVDECTAADTCTAAGTCSPNHVAAGVACGSPTDNDCTNPDSCSGTGVCNANHAALGTACGDTSDTACTNPDTCDAAGGCLQNNAPVGTVCEDNTFFCDGIELCDDGGACDSQGDPCVLPDVCVEVSNSCVAAPSINEFHYDNAGTDANEFVEIFLPTGIAPTDVELVLYNGSGGLNYASHPGSTFTVGAAVTGGTLYWQALPVDALQNGPDGMALVVNGVVVQFLSQLRGLVRGHRRSRQRNDLDGHRRLRDQRNAVEPVARAGLRRLGRPGRGHPRRSQPVVPPHRWFGAPPRRGRAPGLAGCIHQRATGVGAQALRWHVACCAWQTRRICPPEPTRPCRARHDLRHCTSKRRDERVSQGTGLSDEKGGHTGCSSAPP